MVESVSATSASCGASPALGSARHCATSTASTVIACVGHASTHAGARPESRRGRHRSHFVTIRRSGWKTGTEYGQLHVQYWHPMQSSAWCATMPLASFSYAFVGQPSRHSGLEAVVARHRQVEALGVRVRAALDLADAPPRRARRQPVLLGARDLARVAADARIHRERRTGIARPRRAAAAPAPVRRCPGAPCGRARPVLRSLSQLARRTRIDAVHATDLVHGDGGVVVEALPGPEVEALLEHRRRDRGNTVGVTDHAATQHARARARVDVVDRVERAVGQEEHGDRAPVDERGDAPPGCEVAADGTRRVRPASAGSWRDRHRDALTADAGVRDRRVGRVGVHVRDEARAAERGLRSSPATRSGSSRHAVPCRPRARLRCPARRRSRRGARSRCRRAACAATSRSVRGGPRCARTT